MSTPTPYFETSAAQSCALQHQAAAAFLSQQLSQLSQHQQFTGHALQQQSVGGGGHGGGGSGHHSHHSSSGSVHHPQSSHSPPNISCSLSQQQSTLSHSSPSSQSSAAAAAAAAAAALQSAADVVVSAQGSPPQPANGLNPASGFLDLSPAAAAAAAAQFATNSGFVSAPCCELRCRQMPHARACAYNTIVPGRTTPTCHCINRGEVEPSNLPPII